MIPMAPVAAPVSTGGGALLDLLNLDVGQPTPAQPSAGGGAGLGAGLLDLLSSTAPASGQYCTCMARYVLVTLWRFTAMAFWCYSELSSYHIIAVISLGEIFAIGACMFMLFYINSVT